MTRVLMIVLPAQQLRKPMLVCKFRQLARGVIDCKPIHLMEGRFLAGTIHAALDTSFQTRESGLARDIMLQHVSAEHSAGKRGHGFGNRNNLVVLESLRIVVVMAVLFMDAALLELNKIMVIRDTEIDLVLATA